MATSTFKPKSFPVRQPTDTNKRMGSILNPPRLPEIGGATKSNMDQREPSLKLRKPGGTR